GNVERAGLSSSDAEFQLLAGGEAVRLRPGQPGLEKRRAVRRNDVVQAEEVREAAPAAVAAAGVRLLDGETFARARGQRQPAVRESGGAAERTHLCVQCGDKPADRRARPEGDGAAAVDADRLCVEIDI